jgi:prepilin peptidase dependent protein B
LLDMKMTLFSVRSPRVARGLSIVEFMVGIVVGLFIVGGATKLFVDYLGSNRSLLLASRVNQDLRVAADLVARDLRRAGYWRNAETGISTVMGVLPVSNPYRAASAASGVLGYSYAKDNDNLVNSATEQFGIQRAVVSGKGVLQLRTAGAWETITDPATLDFPAADGVVITQSASRVVDVYAECPCIFELSCTKNEFKDPNPDTGATGIYYATRPRLTVREFNVRLKAVSSADATIVRELVETVRVRNDALDGVCPLL